MVTCNDCRDLFWEDLYGLLDADEQQRLHAHVAGCPTCQAKFDRVRIQQGWLAHAARLDVEIPPYQAPAEDGQAPTVLPFASPRRRVWGIVAVAAAVFVAVGLPLGLYQRGDQVRAESEREALAGVEAILAREGEARERAGRAEKDIYHQVYSQHLHFHVEGPAAYRPEAANEYRVVATTLENEPVTDPIAVRLEYPNTDGSLFEETWPAVNGELRFTLPANLDLSQARSAKLEIAAGPRVMYRQFNTPLRVEHRYITHLTTDKATYHPGQTVYFESLTLDRIAFKPPEHSSKATFTLTGPKGGMSVQGQIDKEGVGAGQIVLPQDVAEGDYTLQVNSGNNSFLPATCALTISRAGGAPAEDRPGHSAGTRVEFFPEGGTLIAGLPATVFFHASGITGKSADLQGQVVDKQGVVAANAHYNRASGSGDFVFTPAPGDGYRFRLKDASGVVIAEATLPPAQAEGVELHVGNSVAHAGDALHLNLGLAGRPRHLTVLVSRGGKTLAQATVDAKPGQNQLELRPETGSGAMRVTVCEARTGRLYPLAERLVYQEPRERLGLAVHSEQPFYAPGSHVKLRLNSNDERGIAVPATLLVSVVERTVAPAHGVSVPVFYQLVSELERLDLLDEAEQLLAGQVEAGKTLEMLLGAQSWHCPAGSDDALAAHRLKPGMMEDDNLERAFRDCAPELRTGLAAVQSKLAEDELELSEEGKLRLEDAHLATLALADYRAHAGTNLALGLRSAAFVVLLLAAVMLLSATARRPASRLTLGWSPRLSMSALSLAALIPLVASFSIARSRNERGEDQLAKSFRKVIEGGKVAVDDLKTKAQDPLSRLDQGPVAVIKVRQQPAGRSQAYSYQYQEKQQQAAVIPETLYWNPQLVTDGGSADVKFDMPSRPGIYRLHVEGHTADGRIGVREAEIECRAAR
jgi:hypothetical protein